MATPGRPARLEVRVAPSVWSEEVERLRKGSPGRVAAERERVRLERDGLEVLRLLRCDGQGADGTRLGKQFKVYVPISDGPPSERPFGLVFELGRDGNTPFLSVVAFGERHPQRGNRSVYERAHKRLHGRYPDQERAQPEAVGKSPQVRSSIRPSARSHRRGGLER